MKHPFWIVNLGLLSFVFAAFLFVYFSRIKIASRESIEPMTAPAHKELKIAVNIQKIYENDPFGTYIKELPRPQNINLVAPFPTPPTQQKIVAPKVIEPEFLEPLQITLLGIIVVGSNDIKNRAIIQEDKTKQEGTYKVGDVIQDAQLIRIFRNKVILLRLNGQQEVLYLREQDAKNDASYAPTNEWGDVVKKGERNIYLINPTTFKERVNNLTHFIDMLNSTTAYQKGKSIGLRIGQVAPQSLPAVLGLQKGDIVTAINTIPTETTDQRLAIYKNIIHLPLGHSIDVTLKRNNREMMIRYMLELFDQNDLSENTEQKTSQTTAFLSHKNIRQSEQQHYAFAPTINKIRKADHHMIVENGKNSLPMRS